MTQSSQDRDGLGGSPGLLSVGAGDGPVSSLVGTASMPASLRCSGVIGAGAAVSGS